MKIRPQMIFKRGGRYYYKYNPSLKYIVIEINNSENYLIYYDLFNKNQGSRNLSQFKLYVENGRIIYENTTEHNS